LTNSIVDTTVNLWKSGRRVKTASSGWLSANAPCCVHVGESADTRSRGGLIQNGSGISYHCFNCGYKASYVAGRPLAYKFRKLLSWFGADDNTIRQLVIEAIRLKEQLEIFKPQELPAPEPVTYKTRPLPAEATTFFGLVEFHELANSTSYPQQFVDAVKYVGDRKIDMKRYEFYWTPEVENKLNYRVVVPFKWQGETIGYTARTFVDGITPKYYTQHEPDFVFNTNEQRPDSKFVLVVEGVFDAMAVDGVAILGNECSEQQADIIDSLGKEVVVVPDFDMHVNKRGIKVWPGELLIDRAIEYGWSVSFPVWAETCKDVGEAVERYGKLFVLKTILDSKQHNRLKIELLKRKMFNV
jgi:hypothetical protein